MPLRTVLQDVSLGIRLLRRSPGFTAVVILTLALGIGANTAVFSVMDAMLLRQLPVRNPQELVEFVRVYPDGGAMTNLPYAVFEHLQKNTSVLSAIFALTADTRALRATNDSERVLVHEVSGSFFPALGVAPLFGRALDPQDARPGATNQVAVLSYLFWSHHFGRDPSALGATVRVDAVPYTIVGVMGPAFFGVDPSQLPAMWVPLPSDPDTGDVWVLGRLKRRISIPQAHAQLQPLFQQALESLQGDMAQWPAHDREAFLSQKLVINHAATGTSGLRWEYWEYSNTLKILLGMAALVLLISCANLAALLVARSVTRAREIGIRMAIGAGRGRIVRQLLTENLLWALLGGTGGLLVAVWGHQLILKFLLGNAQETPLNFQLDQRVLGFGLVVSLLSGVVSGILPALAAVRRDVVAAIQQASHLHGGTRLPFARNLLTLQVALSLTLLVGAGLFVRTLRNLNTTDLGLTRQGLLLMTVAPGPAKSIREQQAFWNQLIQHVAALPGVRSVSLAGDAVFGMGGWNETIWVRQTDGSEHYAQVADNVVGPGFFETVGIPLLAGREFGGQDQENSPRVAVVNRAFARKFFNQESPVGRRFGDRGTNSSSQVEIVGVIGDAKYRDVREPPPPMFYRPLSQNFEKRPYELHVRAALHASTEIAAIRREIQSLDGDASVYNVRTIAQVVDDLLQHDRMFALLASAFGLVALVLTSIGIYASMAHQVARRTAEIGLRMALGADRRDILWMTFRDALKVVTIGIALGLPAAWVASRLISSMLYGLTARDPATTVSAVFLILLVAGLAAFLPARRAARLDPLVALRHE
jgi:predicted permease